MTWALITLQFAVLFSSASACHEQAVKIAGAQCVPVVRMK